MAPKTGPLACSDTFKVQLDIYWGLYYFIRDFTVCLSYTTYTAGWWCRNAEDS